MSEGFDENGTLIFDDSPVLAEEWLEDQEPLIQASINSLIKTMAKHTPVTFMQIRKMKLAPFLRSLGRFAAKHGIESDYSFLGI